MKVSVVFSTYNSVEWLQKVLWGFAYQTHKDFEIIIADDGSSPETAELIKTQRNALDLDIKHVWQEDEGFQKCRILNKAVLHAQAPYIVFTDGDCIPRSDFLAVHVQEAKPGRYLSGSYYKLPMDTSRNITQEDIKTQRCFDVQWLYQNGLPKTRKTLKLRASQKWAPLLNALTPTACNLKGSNASAWRQDILDVNGFDERMQWGGLDREFGVRLANNGIKPKHVRYNAICVHLDHSRGYKDPKMVAANKALRVGNAKNKVTWTDHGITQLQEAGYTADPSR